jgi:hypothetical protein
MRAAGLDLVKLQAFTIDGLIGGLAEGVPQHEVFGRGAAMYARHQRRPERAIRAAFTHDGEPRFARQFLRSRLP